MKFSHFFIDRPIFATVLSLVILLGGGLAFLVLPISQYPDIVPPTVEVTARYPGADPKVIAETVATPIEQEVNGVQDMLYMSSQSTSDGTMTLSVTFKLGTNLDTAQNLVQNRVATAEPRLPDQVRSLGVTTKKKSPNLMMVVNLLSPDNTYDQTYISNYAFLQIRDVLNRIEGVGDVVVLGGRARKTPMTSPRQVRPRRGKWPPAASAQNRRRPARTWNCPSIPKAGSSHPSNSARSCSNTATGASSSTWGTSRESNSGPGTTAWLRTWTANPPRPLSSTKPRAPTRWPPPTGCRPPWKSWPSVFQRACSMRSFTTPPPSSNSRSKLSSTL